MTGPATRLLATIIGSVGLALVLAVGLIACSATGSDDRCLSAFRNVDPRALPPYGASPLDEAVRNCGSVRQWQAAWDSVPSARRQNRRDGLSDQSLCFSIGSADLDLSRSHSGDLIR